jgi:hypothetical protein
MLVLIVALLLDIGYNYVDDIINGHVKSTKDSPQLTLVIQYWFVSIVLIILTVLIIWETLYIRKNIKQMG